MILILIIEDSAEWFYDRIMKPSVPEKGTVYRLDGPDAWIMMESGKSCRGCGMAKIGLCKSGGGTSMFVVASNRLGAQVGDTVEIGLRRTVKTRGYLLAYVIPLGAFLLGTGLGHALGIELGLGWLDVAAGFASLGIASVLSFSFLRRLDRSHKMEIKRIVSDGEFTEQCLTDEERRYLHVRASS
ncbi:MAG: hypothetical protein OHK006_11930 [Thermodesulfovibrionales bacterium]